jgi:HSP20 family protein
MESTQGKNGPQSQQGDGGRGAQQQRGGNGGKGRGEGQRQGGEMQQGRGEEQRGGPLQQGGGEQGGRLRQGASFRQQHPLAVMMQLSQEMDRLMDSFFNRGYLPGGESGRGLNALWAPQLEVRQKEDALIVRADLPGVRREDVNIELDDGTLVITGERNEEREEGDEQRGYHSERSYGRFYRAITLPEGAEAEACKAQMKEGVLEVRIPMKEKPQRRRIQVGE